MADPLVGTMLAAALLAAAAVSFVAGYRYGEPGTDPTGDWNASASYRGRTYGPLPSVRSGRLLAVAGLAGIGVVVLGLVLGVALGDPDLVSLRLGVPTAAIGTLVGMVIVAAGGRRVRTAHVVGTATRTAPGEADPGLVDVRGTARPVEEPLTAPFSGRDAVAYAVEVRGYGASSPDASSKRTLETETECAPFDLTGPDGRLRVDPDGATVQVDRTTIATIAPDEDLPERIADWLWENQRSRGTSTETYREGRIEAGDRIRVVGEAVERDGEVVLADSGEARFLIADGTDPVEGATGNYGDGVAIVFTGVLIAVGSYALLLFVVDLLP